MMGQPDNIFMTILKTILKTIVRIIIIIINISIDIIIIINKIMINNIRILGGGDV